MAMQVFYWGVQSHTVEDKTYYKSFSLNGVTYSVGECVYLFPEDETLPHYIGRITNAFVDLCSLVQDPHCIEVKWFERRVNLEPNLKGLPERDKEVVELEETDVNPIGCISGKCSVVKSRSYDEAFQQMQGQPGDWFFCRGVFRQNLNSFVLYRDIAAAETLAARRHSKRHAVADSASPEDVADSEEVADVRCKKEAREQDLKRQKKGLERNIQPLPIAEKTKDTMYCAPEFCQQHCIEETRDAGDAAPSKRRATGRVCVECGATSTPQWREGPAGPKTLCNACGVRYCRAQQRANKRAAQQRIGHVPPPQRPNFHAQKSKVKLEQSKVEDIFMSTVQGNLASEDSVIPRPLRQAAMLAASRTAAFARTGVFPSAEEDRSNDGHGQRRSCSVQHRGREQPTSHDSSHVSSDSAEEVVYTPPASLPTTETEPHVTSTGNPAAESLMPMDDGTCTREHDIPSLQASLATFPALSEPLVDDVLSAEAELIAAKTSELPIKSDFLSAALGASRLNSAFGSTDEVFEHLDNIKHQLPADAYNKLLSVTEAVNGALADVTASDIAVEAVAKVLAARQAIAGRARSTALAASQKLEECMKQLLSVYPIKRDCLEDPLLSLEDATVAESFAAVLN